MAVRRLILLANQYPFLSGDHVFVAAEMPALAAQFDEVVVFNYAPGEPEKMAELPSNVRFGGSLYGLPRKAKIMAVCTPWNLMRLVGITLLEARTHRLVGHLRPFLSGAMVGMGLASDSRLRDAIHERGVATTVYSFWGMGVGLLVPWLREETMNVNLRLHGYDLYEEAGYLPFRPALFRRTDRILAISEKSRRYLLTKYPQENLGEKIFVRRLGSAKPLPVITPAPAAPGQTVVSCSSITPIKRVSRILEALATMPLPGPLKWIHFGGGPLEAELRTKVAALDRTGLTIDIRGTTQHADIIDFYRSNRIDAFINVSSSEGVPVSIMEAISYGIPVVATDVGGTAEIVGSELKTGELIGAEFTSDDLARTLGEVLAAAPGVYCPQDLWARRYNAAVNADTTASLLADRH